MGPGVVATLVNIQEVVIKLSGAAKLKEAAPLPTGHGPGHTEVNSNTVLRVWSQDKGPFDGRKARRRIVEGTLAQLLQKNSQIKFYHVALELE